MTTLGNSDLAANQNASLKNTDYSAFYDHPNFLIVNCSDGETTVFSKTESWKEFIKDTEILIG